MYIAAGYPSPVNITTQVIELQCLNREVYRAFTHVSTGSLNRVRPN